MRRAALFLLLLTGCTSTSIVIPLEWQSVPVATRIRAVQLAADGTVTTALQPLRDKGVRVEGNRLMRGDQALTEAFKAIDSFDVSESRGEVAFSAMRNDNFDIGLVSTDGSPVNWVPVESVDEVGVQWAPRGNKIGFIVRSKSGDFVRTVHIPTSAQLTVDFPNAKIHTLGWDPSGDRFAVAYSTPDTSDRVEVMRYRGAERKVVIAPAEQLAVDVAAFAPEAVTLRPREIEYGEKLPLVVWVDDQPFAWSDARAELIRNARVACIVTRRLTDQIWSSVAGTPWIDPSRTFVVEWSGGLSARRTDTGGLRARRSTEIVITSDPALPPGRYRRNGSVVTAAPAVVQSFASRFIADQLKRTGPPNGSSQ